MTAQARPTLPTTLWAACALWAGIRVGESLPWSSPAIAEVFAGVFAGVAVLGLAVSVLMHSRSLRIGIVLLLCVLGGGVHGVLHSDGVRGVADSIPPVETMRVNARVISDPRRGLTGVTFDALVLHADGHRVKVELRSREDFAPPQGRNLFATVILKPLGSDDYARNRIRSGIVAAGSIVEVHAETWSPGVYGWLGAMRERATHLIRVDSGVGAELVASIVLGDRTGIRGSPTDEDLRLLGLTHLIAISGMHLMTIASMFEQALRRIHIARRARTVASILILGAYVAAIGAPASALRALAMFTVVRIGAHMGRRSSSVSALSGTVIAMLVTSPSLAFDLAFALSAAAVLGIALWASPIQRILTGNSSRRAWLAEPLAVTIAAQALTIPLTVPLSGALPVLSPLANLLAAPVVILVLHVGVASTLVLSLTPFIASAGYRIASTFATLLASGASFASRIPGASLPLGVSGPALGFLVTTVMLGAWLVVPTLKGRRARALAVALGLVVLVVTTPSSAPPSVVVLDVGQGDAIAIRDARRTMLVDVGPDARRLRSALGRQGIRSIDSIVLTHLHADHAGGIGALQGLSGSRTVYVAEGVLNEDPDATEIFLRALENALPQADVREFRYGERLVIGGTALDMIWPDEPGKKSGANESSTILLGRRGGSSFLLTGDAEADVLAQLLSFPELKGIDLLKVGHHGSKASLSEEILDHIRPKIAAISVGEGNRFGHPTDAALALLKAAGTRIDRTDLMGDLVYVLDSGR